jgi:DNA-binding MarR family transcriptional regulator
MPKPVNAVDSPPGRPRPPLSGDAFEASRLLLELIHVAYATRGSSPTDGDATGSGPAHVGPAPSTHAIRAAIHVYQHGDRTVGELASGLGISYGWASRVISELEATGMIVRRTDDADRRVVRVSLAPQAIVMVENAYRWRGEAVERALATLDADGRRAVTTFLRQVIDELAAAGQQRRSTAG